MVNDYTDTTITDILNTVRIEIAQNRAERNKSTNPVIEYQLDQQNTVIIADTVELNGNTQTQTDTIALTDTVSKTEMGTTFRVTNAGGIVSSDYPIKMAFWVVH